MRVFFGKEKGLMLNNKDLEVIMEGMNTLMTRLEDYHRKAEADLDTLANKKMELEKQTNALISNLRQAYAFHGNLKKLTGEDNGNDTV